MNHKYFGDYSPSFDEISKSRFHILVIIIKRSDSEKVIEFLREKDFYFQFTCLAEGTSGSEILDLLGIGSADKTMVLSVATDFRISSVISELSQKLKLHKPGKGIAFTIPLSGIMLGTEQPAEEWNHHMENEVDRMNESIAQDVIIAVVNKGNSEELVEAAKTAGATGGTIINARRSGVEDMVKFFGIPVQREKEIVAIITKRETKHNIMKVINDSYGMKTQAQGIVLSLPVNNVYGLEVG